MRSDLKALISLLDDPSDIVFSSVSKRLEDHGEAVIPILEKAWEDTLDEKLQERIENIIHHIQFESTYNSLKTWVNTDGEDLLEGCYLIAKFQYPDLKYEPLLFEIETIKKDVWLELNNNLTALEKINIVNHIIFDVHKFTGNTKNFYSPQNSYINQVFETKKGNPISLAVVYLATCQRLGLSVYGVNLPKNFILAYVDEWFTNDRDKPVLFYVNPFNRGIVLGKKEIDHFAKQQKLKPNASFYEPCNHIDIVKRLILNLILSYENLGYMDKILTLQKILKLFPSSEDGIRY